jgi:hypothetical protein
MLNAIRFWKHAVGCHDWDEMDGGDDGEVVVREGQNVNV